MKLSDIKANPSNPRLIRDDKFKKLVTSLREFPKMMELRPMVINADNIVLGGNMRLRALKELGYKDIPDEWVKRAETLTEEEQRRFIISDNVSFGEHNWEVLKMEWDVEGELSDWGLDVPFDKNKNDDGEIKFSNELDIESNYVILKFTKDIDFLQIQTLLGLEITYSKRQNGKPWAKGVGRVVDGVDAIIKIKES